MRWIISATPFAVVVAVLRIAEPSFADESPDYATQRLADFAWMDGLDYPSIKKLKFIMVATGVPRFNDYGQLENTYRHGFLLEDLGNAFEVLDVDLKRQTFQKALNAMPNQRVDYAPADLKSFANAAANLFLLKNQKANDRDENNTRLMDESRAAMAGQPLTDGIMTFSLAWFCHHHGLTKESGTLYDLASRDFFGRASNDKATLRMKVAAELAAEEMIEAEDVCKLPSTTRSEMKAKFERIVKHFPKSEHCKRAAEFVAILEQMIREDQAHAIAKAKGKPFDQLDTKDRAKELIYLLREQMGYHGSRFDTYGIFDSIPASGSSAAQQLVELGYDAVPELIEALGDKRLTKAVRQHGWTTQLMTVGDCALLILERISALSLRQPVFSNASQTKGMSEVEKLKAEAKAWYTELQIKGERQWLIEMTRRGDNLELAKRLREKYRKDALPPLIAGARAAEDEWSRGNFVSEIGSIDGQESLRFLLTELKKGPFFRGRYVAAVCLRERGRPEALESMICEWHNGKEVWNVSHSSQGDSRNVAGFLAQSGRPEAIAALAKDLRECDIRTRLEVIEALNCVPIREAFRGDNAIAEKRQELRVIVEDLLVAALDDPERSVGMSGAWFNQRFSDPRCCEFAGILLHHLDPNKYWFDMSAKWSLRRLQILTIKNAWRRENNLPLIPEPKPIAAIPVQKVNPLLDQYLVGKGEQRLKAQAEFDKLGLGAFAAVLGRRDAASANEEKMLLDGLLKRIACTVTQIEFGERSLKPDAALSKKFEEFEGKPLDTKEFLQLIAGVLKSPPPGMRGISVTAERIGDGTGITLRIDLWDQSRARGNANPKSLPNSVLSYELISVGDGSIRSHLGNRKLSSWTEERDADLARAMDHAFASDPDQNIGIELRLALQFRSE